jgi:hypothetical protein
MKRLRYAGLDLSGVKGLSRSVVLLLACPVGAVVFDRVNSLPTRLMASRARPQARRVSPPTTQRSRTACNSLALHLHTSTALCDEGQSVATSRASAVRERIEGQMIGHVIGKRRWGDRDDVGGRDEL